MSEEIPLRWRGPAGRLPPPIRGVHRGNAAAEGSVEVRMNSRGGNGG